MGRKKKQIDSIWLRDWSNPSQADRPNQTNPSQDTRSALARTEHRAPGHEALAQSLAHFSLHWALRPACGWVCSSVRWEARRRPEPKAYDWRCSPARRLPCPEAFVNREEPT